MRSPAVVVWWELQRWRRQVHRPDPSCWRAQCSPLATTGMFPRHCCLLRPEPGLKRWLPGAGRWSQDIMPGSVVMLASAGQSHGRPPSADRTLAMLRIGRLCRNNLLGSGALLAMLAHVGIRPSTVREIVLGSVLRGCAPRFAADFRKLMTMYAA